MFILCNDDLISGKLTVKHNPFTIRHYLPHCVTKASNSALIPLSWYHLGNHKESSRSIQYNVIV